MLLLQIVLALVALGIGIWLGLPGRYDPDSSEIEQIMGEPGRRKRKKVKRHFTPLAWYNRRVEQRDHSVRTRTRFRLEAPEDD